MSRRPSPPFAQVHGDVVLDPHELANDLLVNAPIHRVHAIDLLVHVTSTAGARERHASELETKAPDKKDVGAFNENAPTGPSRREDGQAAFAHWTTKRYEPCGSLLMGS